MKWLTLALGAILVIYSSAGIVLESWFAHDTRAESMLCRFFLCDNTVLVRNGRQQLWGQGEDGLRTAIGDFAQALQRNPQEPQLWIDLGNAFLEAGRKEDARYCFEQVKNLAPNSPIFLLRAANFYFLAGEPMKALPLTARILQRISTYDSVIFSLYSRLVNKVEDVLQAGLPEDSRAAQAWLRCVIREGRLRDADLTWEWITTRRFADDDLASEYVSFLVRQRRPQQAAATWSSYLGPRAGDYPRPNALFNGDFESNPTASPFDWKINSPEGAAIVRDSNAPLSGTWSLRLAFSGTQNLSDLGVSQLAFVEPGRHRFQASVRTDNLTTDEGIRFRIFDAENPALFSVITGHVSGTSPWTLIREDIVIPRQTKLIQVLLMRRPSLKFDDKISGVAWVDAVRLD